MIKKDKSTAFSQSYRVLKMLGGYLSSHKYSHLSFMVFASFLCLIFAKSFSLLSAFLSGYVIDYLNKNATEKFIFLILISFAVSKFFSTALEHLRESVFIRVSERISRNLTYDLFNHLHKLSHEFHLSHNPSAIIHSINLGLAGLYILINIIIFRFVPLIFELIFGFIFFTLTMELSYSIFILAIIFLYITLTLKITKKRMHEIREMNTQENKITRIISESLTNFENIKLFNSLKREAKTLDANLENQENLTVYSTRKLSLLKVYQDGLLSFTYFVVLAMVAHKVLNNECSVGYMVMATTYMTYLLTPIELLAFSQNQVKKSLVDMEQLQKLLDTKPEIIDSPNAVPLDIKEGKVLFKNVSFSYGREKVLDNISFTIQRGEKVAFVGPTGSGKSTLIRLLLRFYEFHVGKIYIDQQDIKDCTQESLRAAMSVVSQDTTLFNDTIFYNLQYVKPEATLDEIKQAAQAAELHNAIMQWKDGYNTIVGEKGQKLSGGEKQRLSIARALLKNAPIIIFDEATSALDSKTEKKLEEQVHYLTKGQTLIYIAHRLSTAKLADKIFVLEKGKIVETGTHEELLRAKGTYCEHWTHYIREEDKRDE